MKPSPARNVPVAVVVDMAAAVVATAAAAVAAAVAVVATAVAAVAAAVAAAVVASAAVAAGALVSRPRPPVAPAMTRGAAPPRRVRSAAATMNHPSNF
jgi:hypothetical protein